MTDHIDLANSQLPNEQFFSVAFESLALGLVHDDLSPRSQGYPWEQATPVPVEPSAYERRLARNREYQARVVRNKKA